MTSTSSSFWGPMGSALGMESMTLRSQRRSISRRNSWAGPNRLSVPALFSETMGVTSPYLALARSRAGITSLYVQKDPQKANPTRTFSIFSLLAR